MQLSLGLQSTHTRVLHGCGWGYYRGFRGFLVGVSMNSSCSTAEMRDVTARGNTAVIGTVTRLLARVRYTCMSRLKTITWQETQLTNRTSASEI